MDDKGAIINEQRKQIFSLPLFGTMLKREDFYQAIVERLLNDKKFKNFIKKVLSEEKKS